MSAVSGLSVLRLLRPWRDVPTSPLPLPVLLRSAPALFTPGEGIFFGLYGYGLPPHRAAYRTLERAILAMGGAPAAGREVFLVENLLAQSRDPNGPTHYAALPERRPIHSLASSRVSSPTGFPTISSKRPMPSSTTSEMRASR
jgi:hypothetical protein